MLAQHLLDGRHGVVIGRQFVLVLRFVDGQAAYLVLALAAQRLAYRAEHGRHDAVEEVVAAHIEIGGLRCEPQGAQLGVERFVGGAGLRKLALQAAHLGVDAVAQTAERGFGVVEVELVDGDDVIHVQHGERRVVAVAVGPYVPDEERPDGLGVAGEEGLEVEKAVVVERGHDADAVQRRRVTLETLYGIDIGVEDVGIAAHLARRLRDALQQVVVVGIDAGYHPLAQALAQVVGQRNLLALAQRGARGQHHLEAQVGRFEGAQQPAPEEDVVVTLDVGHYAALRTASRQAVGRRHILRVEVLGEAFRHGVG